MSSGDLNSTPHLYVNDGFSSNELQNVDPELIKTEIVQWPLLQ